MRAESRSAEVPEERTLERKTLSEAESGVGKAFLPAEGERAAAYCSPSAWSSS